MWDFHQEKINHKTYLYYLLEKGDRISFAKWAELIQNSNEFILFFIDLLRKVEFEGYFWEVKSTNKTEWHNTFEFVIIKSRKLPSIEAKNTAFKEFFNTKDAAISFPNLGGDALLVVPIELVNTKHYGHLAAFIRNGDKLKVIGFWKKVGASYQDSISENYIWLSTAGLGVPWLHIRIDKTPKYYRHSDFKETR